MARTGVCVPLEQHTGLEPAQAAWKAAVLPLHKCCISPPLAESGIPCHRCCHTENTCTVIFCRRSRVKRLEERDRIGLSLPGLHIPAIAPSRSVSPPVHYSGGPVFADCQDKCWLSAAWWRMTESNRPPGRGKNPDRPSCAILPVCPGCHALLSSALPLFSPYRGAGLSLQSDTKMKKE